MTRLLTCGLIVLVASGTYADGPTSFGERLARARAALLAADLDTAARELEGLPAMAPDPLDADGAAELANAIAFLRAQPLPHPRPGATSEQDEQRRDEALTVDQLQAVESKLALGTPAGDYVRARLAIIRLHGFRPGTEAQARELMSKLRTERYREALRRVLDRLAPPVDGRTLGVLLPLSGPYRGLGESALRSIKLAVGKSREVKLVIKDTRGEPDTAAKLADQLAYEHRVVAILGPIGAGESTAAAARAAELGVPILVLSAREDITSLGDQVFRTRLAPSRQGIRLARYAVNELGLHRFGVLVADSIYGWGLAAAFWDEVIRLRGEVTQAATFGRGSRSYRDTLRKLLDAPADKKRAARLDFDGLLIADDHAGVRKLLPFFKFFGVPLRKAPGQKGVQLLGGDGWNHPLIVDVAEQTTENAVFTDAFYPDPVNPRIGQFVTAFYGLYREAPTTFEAEIFDAAALAELGVRRLHQRKGQPANRAGYATTLRELGTFQGVTGQIRFDARGDSQRDALLLTIEKDQIRLRLTEDEERRRRLGRP